MNLWCPTCWEACQSSPTTIFSLIQNSFKSNSHLAKVTGLSILSSKAVGQTQRKWMEAQRVQVKTLVSSSVIAFGGQSGHWYHKQGDDRSFVHGSNVHFINAFSRKLKHGRSNTGVNAFSSFPIFSFSHIRRCSLASVMENYFRSISLSVRGSKGHCWCHSQSNQWQIGPDMCSPLREWDRTAPLDFRLISHRKEYVQLGASGLLLRTCDKLIPTAELKYK